MTPLTKTVYRIISETETEDEYETERAAIEAAIACRLERSLAGTTAEIGEDAATIRFADGRRVALTIERDRAQTTVMRGAAPIATIAREVRDLPVEPPRPMDADWARERPWTALREAALDYAECILPEPMVAVVHEVAAGTLDPEAASERLGMRFRAGAVRDGEDDADFPPVRDLTPRAIREDAHRALNLIAAWLDSPGYRPEHAVRKADRAYKERIGWLCGLIRASLHDETP